MNAPHAVLLTHRAVQCVTMLAIAAASGRAQVVRGHVAERASNVAVPGALVSLERMDVTGAPATSVLSDERGDFALRAPAPGRYRVTAKRIGVKRFISDAFDLAEGATRRVDIVLDAILYQLPEVVVTENPLCFARRDQAPRVASLWEEARTALTATQISLRDRLFQGRVVRYVRELEPRSLAVRSDQRRETRGVMQRPFVSLSGDSLSRVGYWRTLPDGQTEYYAPDADVLVSSAFLRDHCFSVVDGGRTHAGQVGLGFEPVARRMLPDVRGTIWLDDRTFELRFVEFRYTQLMPAPNSNQVGGEVHFARLKSGAWIVYHWFIRMPRYVSYYASTSTDIRRPSSLPSTTIARLIEEGGDVEAEGIRRAVRPATLTGTVNDSAGRPLASATLKLLGTLFSATTDPSGRYRFDSLPPGTYRLVAQHPGYEAIGVQLGSVDSVGLAEGGSKDVSFRAPSTEAIVTRLCGGEKPEPRRATLRVTLLDSATSSPLSGAAVRLTWSEFSGGHGIVNVRLPEAKGTTDGGGTIIFCQLPSERPLALELAVSPDVYRHIAVFRLEDNEVAARLVRTSAPPRNERRDR